VRPKIILNCAASADGKIALPDRRNLKLSNKEDFERVHSLRNECDAILVGIGTVLEDNPSLTVNLEERTKTNPLRVILDTNYRTPKNAKVLDDKAETIIAIGENTESETKDNVEIIRCGISEIDIEKLVNKLGKKGIKSVLVEGGETVMWSFLEKELFDEFNVFISSVIIGGESTPTIAGGKGISDGNNSLKLKLVSSETLGNGVLLRYHKSND
jgi:2,5-diamino-6-(ribosylamino)-4(3H)-pyrimidinone 5'-phosphate reductase